MKSGPSKRKTVLGLLGLAFGTLLYLLLPGTDGRSFGGSHDERAPRSTSSSTDVAAESPANPSVDTRVGFTSARSLDEHYEKHGREFGSITREQYLRLAQELRDAPVGGSVREAERSDGVITRFDARSGAFIAFHDDKTIRTYFKPNDGVRYFERQLDKDQR